ncbi:MAG: class I SAM-dependent methyltransferase [Candidatus Levybacteria bacterium]|nr:class I SAM-dependent methyltransferase [Candidatus Levybacteria bacterium]
MNLSKEEITKKNKLYHDKIASIYDLSQERNHPKVKELYTQIFEEIFKNLDSSGSKKLEVLDIGCGTGGLEEFLNPFKNNILGIDVSEEMLKIAKKKYPKVTYKNIDIYGFKSTKKFDLIVGNAILHHLKDYEFCLEKLIKLLKPGGCIYFGHEPNYFVYKNFSSIISLYRKFVSDKRSVDLNVKGKLESLAEYHMYYSKGINPFKLGKFFEDNNFHKVRIRLSNREFIASLEDRVGFKLIDYVPRIFLDCFGLFSRSFYLTAFKK